MTDDKPTPLPVSDARATYRYLRVGMVLTVVLLALAIAVEFAALGCVQTSISAYYYTPVRAVFVGGMVAVGFALIVIKGKFTAEDVFLNVAGMLAPVVAFAPTMDVGSCTTIVQKPGPLVDGQPETWVLANIDNNVSALLMVGYLGLVIALLIALFVNRGRDAPARQLRPSTRVSLAIVAGLLALGSWSIEYWDPFYTRAHGFAAVAMFVMLIGAVSCKAIEHRRKVKLYFWIYLAIALLMTVGGLAIKFVPIGGDHVIFLLEAYEILLFAVFWAVQTRENWDEEVTTSPATKAWLG